MFANPREASLVIIASFVGTLAGTLSYVSEHLRPTVRGTEIRVSVRPIDHDDDLDPAHRVSCMSDFHLGIAHNHMWRDGHSTRRTCVCTKFRSRYYWEPIAGDHYEPFAVQDVYVRQDGSDTLCDGTADAPASSAPTCAYGSVQRALDDVNAQGSFSDMIIPAVARLFDQDAANLFKTPPSPSPPLQTQPE